MFRSGLVEEVRRLLDGASRSRRRRSGPSATGTASAASGGRSLLEEAVRLTKLDTRHFAKRQMTWFRKMPGVIWIPADDPAVLAACLEGQLAA